jgi:hypothetical protein
MSNLTDDLMLMLVERILKDEPLNDWDLKKFQKYIYTIAVFNKADEKEVKTKIKKFKQAIPNFLQKVSEVLSEAEEAHSRIYKAMQTELERSHSLPEFASSFDHPDMVKFISSLKDTYYSFSAAEDMVGTSRQTLMVYAEAKTHGLRIHVVGRSKRLHKEDLINYYREKYFKGFDYFQYIGEGENYAQQFANPIKKK